VESVDVYYELGALVTELKISNESKSFESGESVFSYYTEEGIDKYLSGNLYSGVVTAVTLIDGGSGYVLGASVPVEGGGGSGAQIIISEVTKGDILGIGVLNGGAGFRANDQILITGGGGSGATANVLSVDISGNVHPNTYNIVSTQILVEANTPLNNAVFTNLKSTNANSWVANAVSAWLFSNCGPIMSCLVLNTGNNYTSGVSLDGISNTTIRSLGILGRMQINEGGLNYTVGDKLEFINPLGCLGTGASGRVKSVEANGKINAVEFVAITGHQPGGMGYDSFNYPSVNVATSTGNGANIIVTAIVGDGETLISSSGEIGKILKFQILSPGVGYTTPPTLNLANMSSGSNGLATATIVTGAFQYEGRYINDDGHLSSYNFLQDRDYYQNYSYVIRVNESTNQYRKAIKDLIHPAGLKMFGQYMYDSGGPNDVSMNVFSNTVSSKMFSGTYFVNTTDVLKTGVYNVQTTTATYTPKINEGNYYVAANSNVTYSSKGTDIIVYYPSHGFRKTDNVRLMFFNAVYANITNGLYTVSSSNNNYFMVPIANGNSAFVQLADNTSNLTVSTGPGVTNSYLVLTQWWANSNVSFVTGDSLNVRGNVVTVVYTVPNSNTIIVSPALAGNLSANTFMVRKAPFTAYGNVRVFDPVMTIKVSGSNVITGDNVYLKFLSTDTSLSNTKYVAKFANSNYIKVDHKDIVNAVSYSGNVNVYTSTVHVTSINNTIANTENVYLIFTSGDLANGTNSLYEVFGSFANGFSILSPNVLTTTGTVTIKTSNVSVTVTGHGFDSNDSVYMWFTTGDTANLTNGYHTITVYDSNRFGFDLDTIPSSNGNITVYRNYMNVVINRINHGFEVGNTVRVMFDTGDLPNVSNGIYLVTTKSNSNTYIIKHDDISISGNIANILSTRTGNVYVSLHK
jgi:hypothetical protein